MSDNGHLFIGGACSFCGCDDHDEAAGRQCPVEREPVRYSTETPSADTNEGNDRE